MRQRHVKQATIEHMTDMGVLFEPQQLKLPSQTMINLEIGSGKGQFISRLAKDHPDEIFIALEIDMDICYRIAEKKIDQVLSNLIILCTSAELIDLWIPMESIDRLYLNFSDPWPKGKHHKRRLTWPIMLDKYQMILKEGGILQLRTDHLDFFLDSQSYMEKMMTIHEVDMHLAPSPYMTEYEEKKRMKGPIYQLKGTIHHD